MSKPPPVVTDAGFRNKVREFLVGLPSSSPGLGLLVKGADPVVMVYPRAGREPSTEQDLLRLTWYEVEPSAQRPTAQPLFRKIDMERFKDFRSVLS